MIYDAFGFSAMKDLNDSFYSFEMNKQCEGCTFLTLQKGHHTLQLNGQLSKIDLDDDANSFMYYFIRKKTKSKIPIEFDICFELNCKSWSFK